MSAPNELSFLPDDYLEQKGKRRANVVCAALVVLVAGGVTTAAYYVRKYDRAVQAKYDEVDAKYTDAARKIDQVKKMHEQQREVVHHAELAASLVEKVPRSNLLAEITNSLPPGVSLVDLGMDSKPRADAAPPANAFEQKKAQLQKGGDPMGLNVKPPQYDVHVKMTGIAQNDVQVAQLMTRLGHSKLFSDVNLVVSETYDQKHDKPSGGGDAPSEPLRRWTIEMMINPSAEVTPTNTAAVELNK